MVQICHFAGIMLRLMAERGLEAEIVSENTAAIVAKTGITLTGCYRRISFYFLVVLLLIVVLFLHKRLTQDC